MNIFLKDRQSKLENLKLARKNTFLKNLGMRDLGLSIHYTATLYSHCDNFQNLFSQENLSTS